MAQTIWAAAQEHDDRNPFAPAEPRRSGAQCPAGPRYPAEDRAASASARGGGASRGLFGRFPYTLARYRSGEFDASSTSASAAPTRSRHNNPHMASYSGPDERRAVVLREQNLEHLLDAALRRGARRAARPGPTRAQAKRLGAGRAHLLPRGCAHARDPGWGTGRARGSRPAPGRDAAGRDRSGSLPRAPAGSRRSCSSPGRSRGRQRGGSDPLPERWMAGARACRARLLRRSARPSAPTGRSLRSAG